MVRILLVSASLFASTLALAAEDKDLPSFAYEVARAHELLPHRRSFPIAGLKPGFNQIQVSLTVSQSGDVVDAQAAGGDAQSLELWTQIHDEVLAWRFKPFLQGSTAVTARVQEYVELVPPERLPKIHITAPPILPRSRVAIALHRSGCFGTCPAYAVEIGTDRGITYDGSYYVVAQGKHVAPVEPYEVRRLAKRVVAADFYSMDSSYIASVTDCPTYSLSIEIDGHKKEITDYMGVWVGMPGVIEELENEVDAFAQTDRWTTGSAGLVAALREEKFDFHSAAARTMLKEAARRGMSDTARELLESGTPLVPTSGPTPQRRVQNINDGQGWLSTASEHPDVLQMFINAGASRNDQADKNLALAGAARSGNLDAVRRLIAYGANANADLSRVTVAEGGGGITFEGPGAGSILIYAAESGNPNVVREILRYHPKLEARGHEGKTAIFAAGDPGNDDVDGSRVECVRLLAGAGADVNARDSDGNTPLHGIFLTDVEEELLKLGADVNARNHDGETPIFTNVNNDSIALFLRYGADLNIRNKDGQTVVQAAAEKGPSREGALREAIQSQTEK